MAGDVDVAAAAALIGDRSRAALLLALMDAEPLPANELAARVGIAPSTASEHLSKLRAGRLIVDERVGRQRYFRLADQAVAEALESLSSIAPLRPVRSLHEANVGEAIRVARTCYDHLAGALGVAVARSLERHGIVSSAADGFAITANGERRLEALGIDIDGLRRQRRPLTRACLDWSEQQYHVAGGLGAALATRFLALRWVVRLDGSRALRVTDAGRDALRCELKIGV